MTAQASGAIRTIAMGLSAVALAATLLSALEATRVNPLRVLRAE